MHQLSLTKRPPITDPTTIPAIRPPLRPPPPPVAAPAADAVLVAAELVVEEGLATRVYPHGRKSVFAARRFTQLRTASSELAYIGNNNLGVTMYCSAHTVEWSTLRIHSCLH